MTSTDVSIHDLPAIAPGELARAAVRATSHVRDENARLLAENLRLRGENLRLQGELLAQAIKIDALRRQARREREQAGAAADLAASQAGAS